MAPPHWKHLPVVAMLLLAGCTVENKPLSPTAFQFDSLARCPTFPDGTPESCTEKSLPAEPGPSGAILCAYLHQRPLWGAYSLEIDEAGQRASFHTNLGPGYQAVAVYGQAGNWVLIHHHEGEWHTWFPLPTGQDLQEHILIFNETSRLLLHDVPVPVETQWSTYNGHPWAVSVSPGPPLHAAQKVYNLTFGPSTLQFGYLGFVLHGTDFEWNVTRPMAFEESGTTGSILARPCVGPWGP